MKKILFVLPLILLIVSCSKKIKETDQAILKDNKLKWGMSVEDVKTYYPDIEEITKGNPLSKNYRTDNIYIPKYKDFDILSYYTKFITIQNENKKIEVWYLFLFMDNKLYSYTVVCKNGINYKKLIYNCTKRLEKPTKKYKEVLPSTNYPENEYDITSYNWDTAKEIVNIRYCMPSAKSKNKSFINNCKEQNNYLSISFLAKDANKMSVNFDGYKNLKWGASVGKVKRYYPNIKKTKIDNEIDKTLGIFVSSSYSENEKIDLKSGKVIEYKREFYFINNHLFNVTVTYKKGVTQQSITNNFLNLFGDPTDKSQRKNSAYGITITLNFWDWRISDNTIIKVIYPTDINGFAIKYFNSSIGSFSYLSTKYFAECKQKEKQLKQDLP